MAWWKKKIVLWIALGVIVCGSGTYLVLHKKDARAADSGKEIVVEVKKGDIRSSVSGTSQFQPKDTQTIIAPSDGFIKTINLERNKSVKKGDLLVELSNPQLENNYQKAVLNYNQAQKDLEDLQQQQGALTTRAPISGKLTIANNIDIGANVNKTSKLATVSDATTLTVTVPFSLEDAVQLKPGDSADLTIDGFMLTKPGSVSKVGKDPHADLKGGRLIDVDMEIVNDGSLDAGLKARASVDKDGRTIASVDSGSLQYGRVVNVLAGVAGTVDTVVVKNGAMVHQGDTLFNIANSTIGDDIAAKQNVVDQTKVTMDDAKDKVDALKITAPFDGVFSTDFVNQKSNILASYPVGAKVQTNTQFGAVANMDMMQLDIQVDELDLPNIKTGMKANVTVDSLPGRVFQAEVSQVSTVGTTTNGVTFFDVILAVQGTSQLKYGMTGTSEILIQDKKSVLLIPIEAVQRQKGQRVVSVKKSDGTLEQREVKLGIRSNTQIEVTEGLKEGEKVVIPQVAKQQNLSQQEIDKMRQQFQQGGAGGAGGFQLSPEQIQQFRQQFQNGRDNGGSGGNGGNGGTRSNGGSGGSRSSGGGNG